MTRSTNRWYMLGILTLVYAFNHVDRQIMVILQEPIKQEFGLSDTQLGMLTGFLFASFYATLGIPFAAWADRGNRRNIIAFAITVWSGMTALSGLTTSFWQLAIARMGVGVGEAGGTPPATAMISDRFPARERAFALGIYTTGISLGILVGFMLGGLVAERFGWRVGFFVAGVPGLLLALLLMLTVAEPKRGAADAIIDDGTAPSLRETLRFFVSQKAMMFLLIGGVFVCISANAFLSGVPLYFIRVHGVALGELGIALGLLVGGIGGVGAIVIGRLCDRLSERDLRWRPWIIAVTTLLALPFAYLALGATSKLTAYALYTVPSFFGLIYASISYAAMQELAPPRMRAMASAVMLLCLTLIGIGLGPILVGILSDFYAPTLGAASIAQALKWLLILNGVSVAFYLVSARYYRTDIARAQAYAMA
ncbi:MAG: spinster family MFS transporter [Litorimonas sp.]